MSHKTIQNGEDDLAPRRGGFLHPCTVLLACSDRENAALLAELFETAACDWRLIQLTDGAEVTRHVMNKGLPDLLWACGKLSKVGTGEIVQWMRSFRSPDPLTIVVQGEAETSEEREQLSGNEVAAILPLKCPRELLIGHISALVDRIEARRFRSIAV